jgi:serine protease Do
VFGRCQRTLTSPSGLVNSVPVKPLLLLLLVPLAVTRAAAQSTDRAAVDRAIEAVYPSLVRISVVVVDHREGREINLEGSGSGTIISSDGYVITNHHVAGRARRIICTLADRQEIPADLIGTDPLSDITVLKLRPASPRTFPAARFGDSSTLRRGDPVLAMGSPRALSQSVTLGVASNTEMTMPGRSTLDLDGEDVGSIVRWIGHDAAIYPGNSGGPLVNLAGEIIGVNEISLGLSGAIPGNLARQVAEALIKTGRVVRSWPGLDIQPLVGTETAGTGALVSWVAGSSPAAAAGVRAGDVLVRVNGTPVTARFAEQVPLVNQLLFGLPVGKPATFVVRREATELSLTLTPIERPPAQSRPRELREWGLVASDLNALEARSLGRAAAGGVRVVSVRNGSPAEQAKPPLLRDDVIVEVDGQRVGSVAELEERTRRSESGPGMLVTFERGRERRLTVVDIEDRAAELPPAEARKAWVPIGVQVLTPPLAERLGLAGRTGVRVTEVYDAALPLRVGDVILAVDGQPVRASAVSDEDVFAAAIRRAAIGATADITVHRGGKEVVVPVLLRAAPPVAREMKRYDDEDFGFRARDIADADRRDPRLDGAAAGALVDGVTTGSWASLGRLSSGDVILAVDGRPVANVDDLAARLTQLKTTRPASVVLLVRRGVKSLFLDLQPAWR